MQIRLQALVPTLALAGLLGSGVGIWAGMHFHTKLADALPPNLVDRLALNAPSSPMAAPAPTTATDSQPGEDVVIYTCGMHPQVQQKTPGNCPICGMPLLPTHVHRSKADQVEIDPVMVQNMGVRTATPLLGHLQETIRAVGTLTEPEQNHREINLRVNGWIQKLYANQEGMSVNAGDPLFELYSPEITAAADELIAARKNADAAAAQSAKDQTTPGDKQTPTLNTTDDFLAKASQSARAAARRKLSLLGLSDDQVAAIEKLDRAPATITITSPIHGHIAEKRIIEGSSVKAGDELLRIADRSSMWMIVQVFEQQLGAVKIGEKVTAQIEAAPGKTFTGTVDFIYPHLDPSTRTAQVRVVIDNADHSLHENMFAQAQIIVAQTGGGGEPVRVLIPREAVLDSGQRQIVFLAKGGGKFEMQSVVVGRSGLPADDAGDGTARYVEILSGLTEDDTVVSSGQFLLDSESRLEEARRKFETPPPPPPVDDSLPGMDTPATTNPK